MVPQLQICAKNRSHKRYGEGYGPTTANLCKEQILQEIWWGIWSHNCRSVQRTYITRDMAGDMVPQLQICAQYSTDRGGEWS